MEESGGSIVCGRGAGRRQRRESAEVSVHPALAEQDSALDPSGQGAIKGPSESAYHELLIMDDDEDIHVLRELRNGIFCHRGPRATLKVEGCADKSHGHGAETLGDACDLWRRPGARPTAHAGGDEDDVCARQFLA